MAKKVSTTAKKVTKKRVKKNVERGQAHIQSSFNNTISSDGSRNCYKGSSCTWLKVSRRYG